jgi:hypothetical protein
VRRLLCAALLASATAAASKYTGPKSAEVYGRIARLLDGAGDLPRPYGPVGVEWKTAAAAGTRIAEMELVAVLSYDDNGWARQKLVPDILYAAVPKADATVGTIVRVRLDYKPAYNGKLEISHTVISTRFAAAGGYTPGRDPWIKKIRALPELNALARRSDDRPFAEALADLKSDHQRRGRPYRMETLLGGEPIKCVTGEHVVQRTAVSVERGPWSVATSESELHDVEFHGKQLTRAQQAQLAEILR